MYYYICSAILKFAGIFIKTDPSLILFVSYGGQKYDDSPRKVYEYIKKNNLTKYKCVWGFVNPDNYPQVTNKVRIDTFEYYKTALQAGYWITNSSASRGLNFRKKETKNILYQHGMVCFKKLGKDIINTKMYKQLFHESFDYIFIEGKEETDILSNAWETDKASFYLTGLPRNDDLKDVSPSEVADIKKKLNIPSDKKVILYAPTYRDYSTGNMNQAVLGIPFSFEKWKDEFKDQYVLVITAHYEVAQLLTTLPENGFVINAFDYPELNDLLKIADILISDYSSIVFDYSVLERPAFCYAYDIDEYREKRGFYNDPDSIYSHGAITNEVDLINIIKNIDYSAECTYVKENIKDRFVVFDGHATEKSVRMFLK